MKKHLVLSLMLTIGLAASAQVKLRMDNKFHIGYDTYTPFLLGSSALFGVDNGRWGIEYWDAMGGLNFWIPWPNPSAQNNALFLRDDGWIGVGTATPNHLFDVWGTVGAFNYVVTSDARLKSNIQPLTFNNQIAKLYQLQGKSYLKNNGQKTISKNGITDTLKLKTIDAHNARIQAANNKTEFGYLAQEMQQIFPELVSGDTSNGYLSINYIGLIPVIIEALKYQDHKIDSLTQQLNSCCQAKNNTHQSSNQSQQSKKLLPDEETENSKNNQTGAAYLLQNNPNPFTENTSISYNIPQSSSKATLFIYDMQGVELKQYNIIQKGEGKTVINGYELNAGMYLYALIIDGKEVDVKRMILTK